MCVALNSVYILFQKPFPVRSIAIPDSFDVETSFLIDEDDTILEECTISKSLPTIQGKHTDLNTISADTVCKNYFNIPGSRCLNRCLKHLVKLHAAFVAKDFSSII